MSDRLHRGSPTSARAKRVDRLMLPAVTFLLLIGAAFVVIAWSEAEDAVTVSQRKDEQRVERLAEAVMKVTDRRWLDQFRWIDEHEALTAPGQEAKLQAEIEQRVGGSSSSMMVAWLVVRADGSVAAIGETTPGRLAANGISDDLRTLGRTAATRGVPMVSGRLKLGDDHVFASAAPIDGVRGGQPSSVIWVNYIDRSALGSLIDASGGADEDGASLLDSNRRLLLGRPVTSGGEHVRRSVGTTGWSLEAVRENAKPLLPGWAYPAFALLLATFAIAYAVQDRNRRRLRMRGDRRATEVHALYDLASRALYAETIEEQAEDLARSAIQLAGVNGATVHVETGGEPIEHTVGTSGRGSGKYRVAIVGPRGPFGELVVSRTGAEPLSEEESWVLGTAATLVGAAMHTLASLETERAAAAELQRLDELRSNLLATVAHELLSPLTAVKGVLGLLSMQEDLGDRGREFVDVATERTDRLVALIRDLFDCSLLETGQLDIRPRRQPADELLEAALGAQAAARPGELRLSATPNLMITVDPVRFDQLVNNLVTNAFRHGEAPVEVSVRPAENGAYVVVSDEGKGIPVADRGEVFGKFWQGSSGHARMAQGAGLGLSLVQGLVRVHGGDITIDSTHADGRGARFTAFFPDASTDRAEAHSDDVDEAPALA